MRVTKSRRKKKMGAKRGKTRIDWERIENETGMVFESTALARKAGVNQRSTGKTLKGLGIMRSTAMAILKAVPVDNPSSYLFEEHEEKSEAELKVGSSLKGWEVTEFLYGASVRDIPFKVGKVYDEAADRFGRCKVFDLDSQNSETREILKFELGRNSNICHRVERDHSFPLAYENCFVGTDKYWVVESWEECTSLQQLNKGSEIKFDDVPVIARNLAAALLTLNNAGVVVRCLTPQMVCLRDDQSLLVRDFELSTFVESTKSRELGEYKIVYYANEFEEPNIDHRADMYSWAQIVIFCLLGKQPPSNRDAAFYASLPVEEEVRLILQSCCEPNPNFRKWGKSRKSDVFTFEDVLSDIKGWA